MLISDLLICYLYPAHDLDTDTRLMFYQDISVSSLSLFTQVHYFKSKHNLLVLSPPAFSLDIVLCLNIEFHLHYKLQVVFTVALDQ